MNMPHGDKIVRINNLVSAYAPDPHEVVAATENTPAFDPNKKRKSVCEKERREK